MISSCLFSLEGPSAYLTLEGQFQSSSLCSQKNTAEVTFVMPFFQKWERHDKDVERPWMLFWISGMDKVSVHRSAVRSCHKVKLESLL